MRARFFDGHAGIFAAVIAASSLGARQPLAAEPSEASAAVGKPDRARRAGEDLRYRHWLISAGGGLWLPSSRFVPTGVGLSALRAGGAAHLRAGAGLNSHLVLFAEGTVGHARGGASCATCRATSADIALGISAHLAQGFAVDPWISYAAGYRHTVLTVDDVPGAVSSRGVAAIDFTKIAMGLDYSPVPVFGFGPYFATAVGVRSFDLPVIYADFQAGVRVTFDPLRARKKLVLSAAR